MMTMHAVVVVVAVAAAADGDDEDELGLLFHCRDVS